MKILIQEDITVFEDCLQTMRDVAGRLDNLASCCMLATLENNRVPALQVISYLSWEMRRSFALQA